MADATSSSSFSRDKTGVRTFDMVYVVQGPTEDGGAEPYEELDNFLPAAWPMGLAPVDRKATKQENGDWLLTITFQGVPDGKTSEDVAELDDSSVEDPIETFPKFADLLDKYKGKVDPNTAEFTGWPLRYKPNNSTALVQNPIYGQTHYLTGNSVLRVTFNEPNFETQYLKNLRKIDKPRVPEKASRLLDLPEGMTWLKKGVKVSFKGNVWQFTIEWLAGHWIPDVYAARS